MCEGWGREDTREQEMSTVVRGAHGGITLKRGARGVLVWNLARRGRRVIGARVCTLFRGSGVEVGCDIGLNIDGGLRLRWMRGGLLDGYSDYGRAQFKIEVYNWSCQFWEICGSKVGQWLGVGRGQNYGLVGCRGGGGLMSTTKLNMWVAAIDVIQCVKRNKKTSSHVKRGRDTKIPQSSGPPVKVGDEAVHKELGDRMERAATTASSLEAEQDSEGSEAFHQIMDFLNASHIKYALIENPKIYISLIQQFWGTATARTTDDGEVEITASIDGQVKTITKASLRRHLKLEDSDGITSLPNTEIFEQLALIGFPQSQNPTQTQVAYGGLHFTSVDVDTRGAATTDIGLEAVKKLEKKVKTNKARRMARIVILDDEDAEEDSSKQERKIFKIDKDPTISLNRPDQDKELVILITAAANLVYIRRSAEKRKDKGKAIMKEDESVQKKTKKQLEQERLGHEEAIRLQEHINEEENQRIARDAEIAKQLQEEFDRARQEQEVVAKADQAHDIDWSDPAVLRYHALQNRSLSAAEFRKNVCMYLKNQGGYKHSHFKGMSYEDIRLIFERVWDQNNAFVPKDSKIEKEVIKRPWI
ncbi:hypothetical protein Tco_0070936 [Tanacetum coccineum]